MYNILGNGQILGIPIYKIANYDFLNDFMQISRNISSSSKKTPNFFKKHIILEATYISSFLYTSYEMKEDSILNATSEHRYCPL